MRIIVSDISLFNKNGHRRKILEALREGPRTRGELLQASGLMDSSYLDNILRSLKKKKYIERVGPYKPAYFRIITAGIKFMDKKDLSEILG